MVMISRDKTKLHKHFFILPFKCDRCGNEFMFEHGLRQQIPGTNMSDVIFGVRSDIFFRYCEICSLDVIKEEEEKEKESNKWKQ